MIDSLAALLPSTAAMATFLVAALVLGATPGPDMTLALGRTMASGRRAGFAVLLGTVSGCLVHVLAAAVGLSVLVATSAAAFTALKVVGALYLLWLAIRAIRSGNDFSLAGTSGRNRPLTRDAATGFAVNVLNPKVALFFLTFLPQFVAAGDPMAAGKLIFLGLLFMVITTPLSVMAILLAEPLARRLAANQTISRTINWLFAAVFGAFAVQLLLAQRS